MQWTRRNFCAALLVPGTGVCFPDVPLGVANGVGVEASCDRRPFKIGLSQLSLRHTIRSGSLHPLDYPQFAIDQFGINQIDFDRGTIPPTQQRSRFLEQLRRRSERAGTNIFLMIGESIRLTSDQAPELDAEVKRFQLLVRQTALVGARFLQIGLDPGLGNSEIKSQRAVASLRQLADDAAEHRITLLIEPRVSASRNGRWLARVIQEVGSPNCGSMPEFGESGAEENHLTTAALLPSAKVILAKSYGYNEEGLELRSDYPRLMQVSADAGFRGTVAIQYQGNRAEIQGIQATKMLLQRLRTNLEC